MMAGPRNLPARQRGIRVWKRCVCVCVCPARTLPQGAKRQRESSSRRPVGDQEGLAGQPLQQEAAPGVVILVYADSSSRAVSRPTTAYTGLANADCRAFDHRLYKGATFRVSKFVSAWESLGDSPLLGLPLARLRRRHEPVSCSGHRAERWACGCPCKYISQFL